MRPPSRWPSCRYADPQTAAPAMAAIAGLDPPADADALALTLAHAVAPAVIRA